MSGTPDSFFNATVQPSHYHHIMNSTALSGIARVAERPLCQTQSFSLGRHAFVPVCASKRAGTLPSAPKWEKRAVQDLADTSEVAQYQELTLMIRIPSLAPILPRVFSLTPRFGTVLTQFRGWVSLTSGLRSLRKSVLGSPVPPLSTTRVPQVSRELGRPKGSQPDSPKMGYEPGSPQQREKADRRN